jgi:menaquinone-dependent protoporphyrinogen oxidase
MSRILILFGTTDGHTAKIAHAVADTLMTEGCSVDVVNARQGTVDVTPEPYDGVIVAASVHIGSFQKPVARWVARHARALDAKPTAFLSVCLGILEHDPKVRQDLDQIVGKFLKATGWHPTRRHFVAGATPFTKYNFIKRWIMKRIAAKTGGDTDTSRDIEYTDWGDLRAITRSFARLSIPGVAMLGPVGSWV